MHGETKEVAINLEIPRELIGPQRSRMRVEASFLRRFEWTVAVETSCADIRTPKQFLAANPQFKSVTKEATERLKDTFGPETAIHKKLLWDRHDPDSEPELFIVAGVRMGSDEAIEKMERLEEEWWFDQFDRTRGRIHLTFKHRAQ